MPVISRGSTIKVLCRAGEACFTNASIKKGTSIRLMTQMAKNSMASFAQST
jgi:hypothetical protein